MSAQESDVRFLGFALSECLVQADPQTEKYLQRVVRTAFELSVYNHFGAEVGGFWLLTDQIAQLRRLPDYYSPPEAAFVANAVELFLQAQLFNFYRATQEGDLARLEITKAGFK